MRESVERSLTVVERALTVLYVPDSLGRAGRDPPQVRRRRLPPQGASLSLSLSLSLPLSLSPFFFSLSPDSRIFKPETAHPRAISRNFRTQGQFLRLQKREFSKPPRCQFTVPSAVDRNSKSYRTPPVGPYSSPMPCSLTLTSNVYIYI